MLHNLEILAWRMQWHDVILHINFLGGKNDQKARQSTQSRQETRTACMGKFDMVYGYHVNRMEKAILLLVAFCQKTQ